MRKLILSRKKIKASALFYALTVALLMSIFMSAVIFLADINGFHFSNLELREQLLLNAHSGINILRASNDNPTSELDLFGDANDYVKLTKKQWGLFEVGVSKAYVGDYQLTRSAQFGYTPLDRTIAIYLADNNKPLSLSGHTFVKGTVYLPKAGVSRAYIEGQSFIGKQLIEGNIQQSNKILPEINKSLVQYNLNRLDGIQNNIPIEEWPDTLTRSFSGESAILYSDEPIIIDQKYKGNIIIGSDSKVTVSNQAQLEDVLIYAPEIEIQDRFNGNLQLFASRSIQIGQQCHLSYPSAVCLLANTSPAPFIRISQRAIIDGIVLVYQVNKNKEDPLLSIEQDALLKGQVYVDGALELKGSVYGNVICSKFLLRTPSSIYENHLLNATIDYSKLSPHYVGSGLLASQSEKKIVKWLD